MDVIATPAQHVRQPMLGAHYLTFYRDLVRLKPDDLYFEIGVNKGKSLLQIDCHAVGVDPAFKFNRDMVGVKPSLQLFQQDSDSFFQRKNLPQIFGKAIDVAFLDGMHHFAFLLRDFINTEPYMDKDGLILLHDCLPVNAEMTELEPAGPLRRDVEFKSLWTGDVWKIIPTLRQYRPDLEITFLDCAPTGMVMIRNIDRKSKTLSRNYSKIIAQYEGTELDDDGLVRLYESIELTPTQQYLDRFAAPVEVVA